MVIIFSLVATFCGFRPWCQQDRTMGRFEFQCMTIFRIDASIAIFKSLIGALQLTSISIFAASTCSTRCGFEPWCQHHCTRGRRVTPAAHAILSQPAPLFVLPYRISIIYSFVQIKPVSMMVFHRFFQFFFTKQGIADTIPNLLSGFGLILWGLSKA